MSCWITRTYPVCCARYFSKKTQKSIQSFPKNLNLNDHLASRKPSSNRSSVATAFTDKHENALKVSPNRLLTRDFIHDSLYNTDYGYFSKKAVIFSPPTPFDFPAMQDSSEFTRRVSETYAQYDDVSEDEALQVWHTPTELFKPLYGYAIAKYILKEHGSSKSPLVIYEMGAGNGTMMCNILTYIQENAPKIYETTQYNIIEISKQLSERQEWNNISRRSKDMNKFKNNVRIINRSIFDWARVVNEPCFFLALEVIDNFAHDAIRYEKTGTMPMLTMVVTDAKTKEISEEYEPVWDPLIERYLKYRDQCNYKSPVLAARDKLWHKIRSQLPFTLNMTSPEFVPTMQMVFLEKLRDKFPRHRLILSDFDVLPTPIVGVDTPLVQTRQRFTMIPCSTYLVTPGWFDIFFPTNFELMQEMYNAIHENGKSDKRETRVCTHAEFLEEHADLPLTRTKNGERPMLEHYGNVKFFLS